MDNQVFFNEFGVVSEIISDALMICEGMDAVQAEVKDKGFNTLSAGIFGIFAHVLNGVYDKMDEMGTVFKDATGVKHPYQMTDEEMKVWASQRGRW